LRYYYFRVVDYFVFGLLSAHRDFVLSILALCVGVLLDNTFASHLGIWWPLSPLNLLPKEYWGHIPRGK
jgi:hypothetical protein